MAEKVKVWFDPEGDFYISQQTNLLSSPRGREASRAYLSSSPAYPRSSLPS